VLPGSGGQLNHLSVLTLDVAGAYPKWALNISGPNSDWALSNWAFGLDLGQWVSLAIEFGPL
jgi:hypothetical protein